MQNKKTTLWIVYGDLTICSDPPEVFARESAALRFLRNKIAETWAWVKPGEPIPSDVFQAQEEIQDAEPNTWAGSLELVEVELND